MTRYMKAVPGRGIVASTRYIRSNTNVMSKAKAAFDDWKQWILSQYPLETDSDSEFSWYNEDGLCTLQLKDVVDYFSSDPDADVNDIDMSALIICEESNPWGY